MPASGARHAAIIADYVRGVDIQFDRAALRAAQLSYGIRPDIRTSPMERTADSVLGVIHGVLVGGSLIGTL